MRQLVVIVGLSVLPWLAQAGSVISLVEVSILTGNEDGETAGSDLAEIGDINADGYTDVAIGAPGAGDGSAGAVYLLYGRAERIDELVLEDLPTLRGEVAGDKLGSTVAGLGDINGDGYADFAATSTYHDAGTTNPGTVYIIYGQAEPLATQTVTQLPRFYGEDRNDHAGGQMAGVGDVNADGYDDLLISATWHNDKTGGVYLVYGQAEVWSGVNDLGDHPLLAGSDDYDYAGNAVTGGDVTNDGLPDMLVSATRRDNDDRDVGYVYIIPGRALPYTSQPLTNFAYIAGATTREKIGYSLAVANMNGDSYNDVVIGAPYNDSHGENAGAVYIVLGQASVPASQTVADATVITGETAGDLFGKAVHSLGDISSDGIADLLIGAPSELAPEAGLAVVLLGSSTLTSHIASDDIVLTGEILSDGVGTAVTGADLNADGLAELFIAAPGYDAERGKVYLGYWPIYTCDNSVALGGILADYPTTDYKLRNYAKNRRFKIVVERRGQQAFLVNCNANRIEQTLTFNTRTQRKILARVFSGRRSNLFIAITRTPSKRKIKIFLYKQTKAQLVPTYQLTRKWRPRGFRIKLQRRNRVILQKGQEQQHRLRYSLTRNLTLSPLD